MMATNNDVEGIIYGGDVLCKNLRTPRDVLTRETEYLALKLREAPRKAFLNLKGDTDQ